MADKSTVIVVPCDSYDPEKVCAAMNAGIAAMGGLSALIAPDEKILVKPNFLTAAADCLVPGIGEIIGGSQREERLDILESRIRELGMNPADYWWYCDLRRYGSCRHSGFGLGFERMVMYCTGVSNIRDVELHPRTVGNAEF